MILECPFCKEQDKDNPFKAFGYSTVLPYTLVGDKSSCIAQFILHIVKEHTALSSNGKDATLSK